MEALDKFKLETNGVIYYSAYLLAPQSAKTTLVPESAQMQVFGQYNPDMTVEQFSLKVTDLEDGDCLILCSANFALLEGGHLRSKTTSEADLIQWVGFIEALGYTLEDLCTQSEANELEGEV